MWYVFLPENHLQVRWGHLIIDDIFEAREMNIFSYISDDKVEAWRG